MSIDRLRQGTDSSSKFVEATAELLLTGQVAAVEIRRKLRRLTRSRTFPSEAKQEIRPRGWRP